VQFLDEFDLLNPSDIIKYGYYYNSLPEEERARLLYPENFWTFKSLHQHLWIRARVAAFQAKSYRGFKVGCAMLGYRRNVPVYIPKVGIVTGFNIKESPNGPKTCAEQNALEEIKRERFDLVIALAVAGVPQEDHASGKCHENLYPCGGCRKLLVESPYFKDNTVVLMAHLEHWIFDVHFVRSLMLEHEEI